jgi:RNA polymerase sigma-70 factor (ECF subfamily)
MESTSRSLLFRARQGHEPAWQRIVSLYRPLIHGYLLRQGVRPQEADDLTQDVLAVLVRELPRFEHGGRTGAFRSWLRQITVNRAREFWRAGKCRAAAVGGSDFLQQVEQLADDDSVLTRTWDEEHDRHVLRHLLSLMEDEFGPELVRAFHRLTFEGAPAREVAAELGMSVGAVYTAKSRVLARLREEAVGLLD